MSDDLKKPEEMDMYDEEIIKELEELDNEALDIDEELDFDILDFDDEEEPDYDWGMDELLDVLDFYEELDGCCGCHSEPEDDLTLSLMNLMKKPRRLRRNGTTDGE